MDIHELTDDCLKMVQKLQQDKQKKVSDIRSMKYTTKGRIQILLTPEDSAEMVRNVSSQYDRHCSRLYEVLNQERNKAGLPALNNPYKKG